MRLFLGFLGDSFQIDLRPFQERLAHVHGSSRATSVGTIIPEREFLRGIGFEQSGVGREYSLPWRKGWENRGFHRSSIQPGAQ